MIGCVEQREGDPWLDPGGTCQHVAFELELIALGFLKPGLTYGCFLKENSSCDFNCSIIFNHSLTYICICVKPRTSSLCTKLLYNQNKIVS